MIFCHCAAVSDSVVARTIAEGADSVSEVMERCGAGRHCSPCRDEIAALLYEERSKRQNPSSGIARCDRRAA